MKLRYLFIAIAGLIFLLMAISAQAVVIGNGSSMGGGGVIQNPSSSTCATASTSVLGCVKVDGTTITIGSTGVITSVGGGSSGISIGTTTIGGGTSGRVLYDNAGVAGELVVSGTGNVCLTTNCVLTTPALGTPSAIVLTNGSGTAASLTAGTVTTNANLTGPITSSGNATSIAAQTGTGTTFAMQVSPNFTTSIGIGTSTTTNAINITGQSAQTISMVRETTAVTAGNGLTLQAGGAVAVGTNLNGGDLNLSSGIATGTGTSNIQFKTYPAGSSGTTDGTQTTRMTILGSGFVGINNTAPGANLHVTTSTVGGGIIINGESTNSPALNISNAGFIRAELGFANGSGAFSSIANSGDVVLAAIQASGGNLIIADKNSGHIKFSTGTTETLKMIILNGGNVGIGSATPANTLDVNGGVSLGTSAATQFILSTSGGVQIGTTQNLGVGTVNVAGGYYTNGTQAVTRAGTGLSASGATINSNAVYQMSFQPGLVTSVTNTKSVFSKVGQASTVDNMIGSASAFSCVSNPTITMYECGTDASCATSPVTIGTATITAAGQAFTGTVSNPAITANDFVAFAISAGTCTSLDIGATAQVHSN